MDLNTLDWMKDVKVSTHWSKDYWETYSNPKLSVKVQGPDSVQYLRCMFTSDTDEGVLSFDDDYWSVIWARLITYDSMKSWCNKLLSDSVQAELAVYSLWGLIGELNKLGASGQDIKAIGERAVILYSNLLEIKWVSTS